MASLIINQTNLYKNEIVFSNQTRARFKIIYEKAEHVWSYLGKMMILTRHLLNATSKSCQLLTVCGKDFPGKAVEITTRLKLFSIVSVPFSLTSLKSISAEIFKSFLVKDIESVTLSSLSFTIITIDLFDSMTTFVNATLAVSAHEPIASLSALSLPFGFGMSGLGIVSRIIQISKACQVYKSIRSIRKESLEAFLEKKLDVTATQARIVTLLRKHTLRTIPVEIGLKLQKLYDLLANNRSEALTDQEMDKISQILDEIQDRLKKKFIIEGLGTTANTLIILALFMFCWGSLSAVPFVFLATSFFIRISSLTYQDLT
jgi:hypothetical protein